MMKYLCISCLLAVVYCDLVPPTPDRHLTLSAAEVFRRRVFVIGDVHGCYDELMALLRKVNLINDADLRLHEDVILILAGDIINRGPKNLQTLRWARSTERVYNIFGNHELNILERPGDYPWTVAMTEEDRAWVESLPYTISIPSLDALVVHAGIKPDRPLNEQSSFVMTRMRNIEERRGVMIPHEDRDAGGDNWATFVTNPPMIYYGHDAGRGRNSSGYPIIQFHPFATGLDSRCWRGGKLSGALIDPQWGMDTYHQVWCVDYRDEVQKAMADNDMDD